jgi:hypothetical protein
VYQALIKTPGALRPYGPTGPHGAGAGSAFSPFALISGGASRSAAVSGRERGAASMSAGGGSYGGGGMGLSASVGRGESCGGLVDMRAGVAGGRRRTNLTANPFMNPSSLQVGPAGPAPLSQQYCL